MITHDDINDMVIIVSNTGRIQTIIQPGMRIAISEGTVSLDGEHQEASGMEIDNPDQQAAGAQTQASANRA